MADEFQSGLCSGGGSWWNTARTSSNYNMPVSLSCSTAIADVVGGEATGAFSWTATELMEAKVQSSCEETSASNSTVIQSSDHHVNPSFMDSSLQLPTDWTQTLLRNTGRVENNFQAILQEDLNSSRSCIRQDQLIDQQSHQIQPSMHSSSMNQFKDINHNFLLDINHNLSTDIAMNYPIMQACSSNMMQGFMESSDNKLQNFIYDGRDVSSYQSPVVNYGGNSNESMQTNRWTKFTELLKSSPMQQQQQQQQSNQLQFSNNTNFWNASATSAHAYVSAIHPQYPTNSFESKNISANTLVPKSNQVEGLRDSCSSSSSTKKASSEPAFKKPRIETPSPLPTFKVRKEKLGDRITALQQLVSPFGKTDTASVLHEAIEYIKFLHDQVSVLSTPYLKNGHPMQQQQQQQQGSDKMNKDGEGTKQLELRSRGLCLVPISSTYPVASETTVDFWHPTFGGTFR